MTEPRTLLVTGAGLIRGEVARHFGARGWHAGRSRAATAGARPGGELLLMPSTDRRPPTNWRACRRWSTVPTPRGFRPQPRRRRAYCAPAARPACARRCFSRPLGQVGRARGLRAAEAGHRAPVCRRRRRGAAGGAGDRPGRAVRSDAQAPARRPAGGHRWRAPAMHSGGHRGPGARHRASDRPGPAAPSWSLTRIRCPSGSFTVCWPRGWACAPTSFPCPTTW